MSLLDKLQGYRTKLAALALAALAVNEVWHFLPAEYTQRILYLAGAGGLYFMRDALERVKQKLDAAGK
jgi:hypothetical protein